MPTTMAVARNKKSSKSGPCMLCEVPLWKLNSHTQPIYHPVLGLTLRALYGAQGLSCLDQERKHDSQHFTAFGQAPVQIIGPLPPRPRITAALQGITQAIV